MNVEYANTIPLRKILGKLGLYPVATSQTELLYISPFNTAIEPNFVVDIKANTWTDLTDNTTGSALDFVYRQLRHYGESDTAVDADRWIKSIIGYVLIECPPSAPSYTHIDCHYSYVDHQHLQTPHLIHYLEQVRGIPLDIARFKLVEVNIHNLKTGKRFLTLGNRTDENTYCVRNEFCKVQLKTPYVSFIEGTERPRQELNIFKDVFDYLTAIDAKFIDTSADALILNSYRNMPASSGYINQYPYKRINTWLNNNPTGKEATENYNRYIKSQRIATHKKMNSKYASYSSLNAWHLAIKKQKAEQVT